MCGIALIISGARIDSSSISQQSCFHGESRLSTAPETERMRELVFSLDDLKAALLRRGPDRLGCKKVFLQADRTNSVKKELNIALSNGDSGPKERRAMLGFCSADTKNFTELQFLGAVLQLRGICPVLQPLVDTFGNILVFNGEIFGGIDVKSDTNDAEILIHALGRCCTCEGHGHKTSCYCDKKVEISIPELFSAIKGPWALVYWQAASKTIWFGRDAFGRRSLLVHWPTLEDPRFILSSVSPSSSVRQNSGFETENGITNYWEELSCGLYTISFDDLKAESLYKQHDLVGEVRKHEWTDTLLKKLIQWERTCVEPKSQEHSSSLMNQIGTTEHSTHALKVLIVLRESVMRRTIINKNNLCENGQKFVPVAVLFSGGLDSMILAALLDQCLNSRYDIDLLNVSFDGQLAPDRISAKAGLHELQKIAPSRRWRLVEIDANLSDLTLEVKHVMSLIDPANTYMDLNIGIALWLAAGGDGWVDEGLCDSLEQDFQRCKYKSKAAVLLVGSGADEQCAGYSRYKTKYKQGSWNALEEEMKLDMQRIWKRNLGRDDRCISDNGKEARFPFLDEDVMRTLLEIPLWDIADLDLPIGRGDKKILREVARLLGLEAAAAMPKRAIQFGSRIARESNRMNFGSNRAANQAAAGSVVIRGRAD